MSPGLQQRDEYDDVDDDKNQSTRHKSSGHIPPLNFFLKGTHT